MLNDNRIIVDELNNEQKFHPSRALSFLSNDYFALSKHPQVIQVLNVSAFSYGIGSGGSYLVGGCRRLHIQLEEELSSFLGTEKCILTTCGYMANFIAVDMLSDYSSVLLSDVYNHISAIDAANLFDKTLLTYDHNNMISLSKLINANLQYRKAILVNGVFSCNGNIANLPKIIQLKKQHKLNLILDDAHGIGTIGKTGRGCLEFFGLSGDNVDIITGTFAKAFGIIGGFVAGKAKYINFALEKAKHYIYTTSMPPAIAGAVLEALKLIKNAHESREYLAKLGIYFQLLSEQYNINVAPSLTPIQAFVIKDLKQAIYINDNLVKDGILARLVNNSGRDIYLKIALNITHNKTDLDFLFEKIKYHLTNYNQI